MVRLAAACPAYSSYSASFKIIQMYLTRTWTGSDRVSLLGCFTRAPKRLLPARERVEMSCVVLVLRVRRPPAPTQLSMDRLRESSLVHSLSSSATAPDEHHLWKSKSHRFDKADNSFSFMICSFFMRPERSRDPMLLIIICLPHYFGLAQICKVFAR